MDKKAVIGTFSVGSTGRVAQQDKGAVPISLHYGG